MGSRRVRASGSARKGSEIDLTSLEACIAELQCVTQRTEVEGWTLEEVAEAMDVCRETARGRVREAIEAGKWHCAGRVMRERINGVPYPVSVYAPVKEEKE